MSRLVLLFALLIGLVFVSVTAVTPVNAESWGIYSTLCAFPTQIGGVISCFPVAQATVNVADAHYTANIYWADGRYNEITNEHFQVEISFTNVAGDFVTRSVYCADQGGALTGQVLCATWELRDVASPVTVSLTHADRYLNPGNNTIDGKVLAIVTLTTLEIEEPVEPEPPLFTAAPASAGFVCLITTNSPLGESASFYAQYESNGVWGEWNGYGLQKQLPNGQWELSLHNHDGESRQAGTLRLVGSTGETLTVIAAPGNCYIAS